MTPPRPPERGLPWILAAVIAAGALVPPETDGGALAAVAALAILACIVAAATSALPSRAWLVVPLLGVLAIAARFADAPGAAVLPAATAVLAAALAIAARGAPAGTGTIALAASGAFVGARAIYDVVYGLRALAERVRADATSVPSADLVLGRLEQGRAYAGFPTPAAAGGFLALAIPVTVALAVGAKGPRRAWLGGAAALEVAGLVATRSLTAAAALLGALLLGALVLRSRRVAIAAAAVVVAVALLAALRAGQVFSRSTDDSPWKLRFGNVRIGAEIAADHPWKGVGPGGYGEAFARYRTAADNEARHAHCLPVELAADLGLPLGLAAGAALLAFFLAPLLGGLAVRTPLERGAAIGVAAFALQNLADFTSYLPSVLIPAVLLRAALSPRAVAADVRGDVRTSFAVAAALAGAVVVLAGMADAAVDRATTKARDGRLDDALRAAERAGALAPWSVEAALVEAQARAARGLYPEALAAADRAVLLVPVRASAREVRSRIRLALSDLAGAYSDLERAVALNPRRAEYAQALERVRAGLP